MPILKNPKHELFAQNCAKGESEDASYAAAYPTRKPGASRRGSASELRSKPIVAARILEQQKEGEKQAIEEVKVYIATKQDRQAFWTKIMAGTLFKDEGAPEIDIGIRLSDRIKASELLGKSECDFLQKHEVTGKLTLEDLVAGMGEEEKK